MRSGLRSKAITVDASTVPRASRFTMRQMIGPAATTIEDGQAGSARTADRAVGLLHHHSPKPGWRRPKPMATTGWWRFIVGANDPLQGGIGGPGPQQGGLDRAVLGSREWLDLRRGHQHSRTQAVDSSFRSWVRVHCLRNGRSAADTGVNVVGFQTESSRLRPTSHRNRGEWSSCLMGIRSERMPQIAWSNRASSSSFGGIEGLSPTG